MTDGSSASATSAYTRIYEEQHPRLVAYARSLTRNSWTAEDLVAEAHFRVWRRLSGGHEIDNVPAYLMTTVRHLAAAVGTATRETPLDPTAPERVEADVRLADTADPAEQVSAVDLLVRVLGQLPDRWVQALWLAEAEGQPLETVGQRIGAKQGATAVLLHRAREGMRQAFLREQPGAPIDPACQVRWGRMPAYVRGTATSRQSEQLLSHVDACDDCRARLSVLMRTNDRLPALVGPALLVFVVGGGAGKLLLSLTAGSAGTAAALGGAGGVGGHGGGQLLHAVRQAAGGVSGAKIPTVAAVGAAAAAAAVVAGVVLGPLDSGAVPPQRVPLAQAPAPHRPEVPSPAVAERRNAVTDAVVSPGERASGTGGTDASSTGFGDRDTGVVRAGDGGGAVTEPTVRVPADDDVPPGGGTAPDTDTDADAPTGGGDEGGTGREVGDGDGSTGEEGNEPGATAPEPPDAGGPEGPAGPGAETPAGEEPGVEAPVGEEPGVEAPVGEEPGVEQPGAEEPGNGYPEVDEPGVETPGADEPHAEEPAPEVPAADEPTPVEETPAEEVPPVEEIPVEPAPVPPEVVEPAPEVPVPVEPAPEVPGPGGPGSGC
ncbi:sigma-70 family RNA polymerase sigma factor [Streptomyces sp. NBC_00391]|uniref:sigma-70 family RNA polymerase sigma factor n=1 Tax=Streptomyces sp. NBC_00391 TaxID=2903647 RepID=UPI002E1BB4E0